MKMKNSYPGKFVSFADKTMCYVKSAMGYPAWYKVPEACYEGKVTAMQEILEGRGREGAFTPAPGLKEFLEEVKGNGVRIGLVTSGLYNKAMPEIISAFQTLKMGDPLGFEDSSAGIMSIRLAGFAAVGINGGNIHKSGLDSLCMKQYDLLMEALPLILGKV